MEKNEVIKQAYEKLGIAWESINHATDYDGWMSLDLVIIPELSDESFDCKSANWIRPKSLHNIEKNNGWTKIEKWKRMPKRSFFCQVILKTGRKTVGQYVHTMNQFCVLRSGYMDINKITHFAEVTNNNEPLY